MVERLFVTFGKFRNGKMSKIGRKPIRFFNVQVDVAGRDVVITGPKNIKLEHRLPEEVSVVLEDKKLILSISKNIKANRMLWGLHRALLKNKIEGLEKGFERSLKIVGLGYKAQLSGKKLIFSLGYSHKIEYPLPENVSVEVDKTGQNLTFKSYDINLLGHVCDSIKSLRMPEPYKGTGIMYSDEVILRKAGKTGAAA